MLRLTFYLLAMLMPLANAAELVSGEPGKGVIVVCPKGWESALGEWRAYREKDYSVIQIESKESANDLRQSILRTIGQSKIPIQAVLLCGDVVQPLDAKAPKTRPKVLTPTFETPTRVKLGPFTTPTMATDAYFGDLNDDECPDIAVGRLPAKSPDDLKRMLNRSMEYEQSQSFGPWRDRIHAVAGVGGFGVMADTAIETVTRRLLSEGIPDRFQLQMTYASLTSPYCPDPSRLTSSFINRLNEGGLFWVYIGHGNVHCLDDFIVGNEEIPICTSDHIPQFKIQDGPPIAVMLACFTGAFDARIDCFAEQLLSKDDGPIAVIAGSRVTMPYGLSQFSAELMEGCFNDRIETLGDVVLQAKRNIWKQIDATAESSNDPSDKSNASEQRFTRLREKQQVLIEQMAAALSPDGHDLKEERREHVRLMNLLGDPLLRIRQPMEVSIQCSKETDAGAKLRVTGTAPMSGKLRLELALSRDRLPEGIKTINEFAGTNEQRELMQSNYDKASDLVLYQSEQDVAPGEFEVDVPVPMECRGRCVLRAYVYGEQDWATGSQRLNVRRTKK